MSQFFYSRIRRRELLVADSKLASAIRLSQAPHRDYVVTLLDSSVRGRIDLIFAERLNAVHTTSVHEACREMEQMLTGTLIVSALAVPASQRALLLATADQRPGVSIVTVIEKRESVVAHAPLRYANCTDSFVDLSESNGVRTLRGIVGGMHSNTTAAVLETLLPVLQEVPADVQRLFVLLLCLSPRVTSTRAFGRCIGVRASTLTSRFFRARLPSIKTYLAMFRLLHVAAHLEDTKTSVAAVSRVLNFSSPQALSRHIQITFGMSAVAFRQIGFQGLLTHIIRQLFTPFQRELSARTPLGSQSIHMLT